MCGRYALGIRASFVRHQMRDANMQVDDDLDDDATRGTYNFAPGYRGMVYRANTPPSGAGSRQHESCDATETQNDSEAGGEEDAGHLNESQTVNGDSQTQNIFDDEAGKVSYKLQAMQWGLIPFWTKRDPGFGSMVKTINCRDDSLARNGGMWNTMKKNKRCIVVAQGFYEWQKKDGGKTKIPHFVKRKDGSLMCFAGLWDSVQYEGRDERLYTYTIITTEVNQKLAFLHDRMPVILDMGSKDMDTWLDPSRTEWSKELQGLLEPYPGELECYPVDKSVGKVGNDSPNFIVPVDSPDNKNNIANFFGNASSKAGKEQKHESNKTTSTRGNVQIKEESRATANVSHSEDNAPLPVPEGAIGKKHDRDDEKSEIPDSKQAKIEDVVSPKRSSSKAPADKMAGRKTRSATSNNSAAKDRDKDKSKASDGSQRITNFLVK